MVSYKWLPSGFLARHRLGQPLTVLATDDVAFERALRRLPFPTLLKPGRDLVRGRGIRRFGSAEELRAFFRENPEHWGSYMVQSFVRNYDVDCNVLCREREILAHTIQTACIPSCRLYSPSAILEFGEDGQGPDSPRDCWWPSATAASPTWT